MKYFSHVAGVWIVVMLTVACSSGPSKPIPLPPPLQQGAKVELPDAPPRQFDFWLGEWDVNNKRAGRSDWKDVGPAQATIQSVADGAAILEHWDGVLNDKPLFGFSLRAYDEDLERWVVWLNWSGGAPDGFNEMRGGREGDRVSIYPRGDETSLRYSFTEAHENSCQWEQAISKAGQPWITNWVMQFSRRQPGMAVDARNAPIVAPHESVAEYPQTRVLDFMLGAWEGDGYSVDADGTRREGWVRVRTTTTIRGLMLLQFVDTEWGAKDFSALGWDRGADGWIALHVDNQSADRRGVLRMAGDLKNRGVQFTAVLSGLRDTWTCPDDASCSWQRETSADNGATWAVIAEADLHRSVSSAAYVDIRNARTPFEQVLSGGQPTEDQLRWAARNGYRTVVNLRGPGEPGELPDEAALVGSLGMNYVAIPMSSGEALNADNAAKLAQVMAEHADEPIIVHCASGNRVGALFGLKAHLEDGLTKEAALAVAHRAGISRLEPVLRQRLDLPPGDDR